MKSVMVACTALVLAASGACFSAGPAEVELEQSWSHVRVLISTPFAEDGLESGDAAADLSRIVETKRADGTVIVQLNGVGMKRLRLGTDAQGRPVAICDGSAVPGHARPVRDLRFPSQSGWSHQHATR